MLLPGGGFYPLQGGVEMFFINFDADKFPLEIDARDAGRPRPHKWVKNDFAGQTMQSDEMLGERDGLWRGMVVALRVDSGNMPDDVLDFIGFIVPFTSRARYLAHKHRLVASPVMPAHPHRPLVPYDHLFELKNLVHP